MTISVGHKLCRGPRGYAAPSTPESVDKLESMKTETAIIAGDAG
jgi:hypothetical protein